MILSRGVGISSGSCTIRPGGIADGCGWVSNVSKPSTYLWCKEGSMIDEGTLTAERLTLLYSLGQAFSSLMTLDVLLPSIITKTKEIMQAESCALLLLDEEHQEFYFPVTSDLSP